MALSLLLLASGGVGTTLLPTVVTSFPCPKGEGSRQLLDAKVKLITNTQCNSHRLYNHMIDETMICAGNLQKPGPDTCQVSLQTHSESKGLAGPYGHRRPMGPGLGGSPGGPPATRHRHRRRRRVCPLQSQSRINRDDSTRRHCGHFACVASFHSWDSGLTGAEGHYCGLQDPGSGPKPVPLCSTGFETLASELRSVPVSRGLSRSAAGRK